MRLLVTMCLLVFAVSIAAPATAAKSRPAPLDSTLAKTDTLVCEHKLVRITHVDPSAESVGFEFIDGSKLRIKVANIDFIVDPTQPLGRVYLRFIARSEIPGELEKVLSWDYERANNGYYRTKLGERSIRPEIEITLVFPDSQELIEYHEGFTAPTEDGTIYEPPTVYQPKEGADVQSTR